MDISMLQRFMTLTAGDIMSKHVVQIPSTGTLKEAAAILREHEISGAPVVDEAQRCVGMLSASDFVRKESEDAELDKEGQSFRGDEYLLEHERDFHIGDTGEDCVSEHMSTAVQTVRVDTPIIAVAREICAEHIHRVVVLDESNRVAGVVTTLDLIAAMLNVIDEAKGS